VTYVNAVVQGVLLGGLYALLATGLSLTFGVMRLVNLAHGDLAVLGGFACLSISEGLGWNPLVSLVLVLPGAFALGWLLDKAMFNRIVNVDPAYQIVATFGLAVVIQNLLLERYTANQRRLEVGSIARESIRVTDEITIGWMPLITFLVAVAVLVGLSLFLHRTSLGRAVRATSDDTAAARLMGIDNKRIYGLALAISVATAALAGVFLGIKTQFDPSSGPIRLIFAFEAVIIGGLGSLWGTLAGGVTLGVAQTVGEQYATGWGVLIGNLVFLAVLAVRPTGFFGKAVAT
jgi:branched-chain amino acid transport system permease protein